MFSISVLRAAAVRRSTLSTLNLRSIQTSARARPSSFNIHAISATRTPLSIKKFQWRSVASSVSSKPPSEDLPHAILNAREEARHAAQDLAKIIAGSNYNKSTHEPLSDGFRDITLGVASEVPKPILYTGLAGALPYVGTAVSTLYYARQAGQLAAGHAATVDYDTAINLLEHAATIQVTYGAVLLSFLGALHWGMEFAGYNGHKGYPRLFLGAAPVLYAWPTLALSPEMGLVTQWAGFTALWYADLKATNAGWTPIWYSQYRFYLSLLVGTCIIAVLTGENYFNPVIEATTLADKERVSSVSHTGLGSSSIASTTLPASSNTPAHLDSKGKLTGTVKGVGDLETIEGEESYVLLHKKDVPKDDEAEGQGEGKSDKEMQETKESQKKKHEDQKQGRAGDIKQNHEK